MEQKSTRTKTTVKFILLLAFVVGAFVGVRTLGISEYLDEEALRSWIEGFGVWGPLVYIAIYSIAPSLMLPGLPLTVVGGILFGPVWGTVYVITGATIGASLAFLLARHMGRDWVAGAARGRLEELDKKVAESGWKIVAFTRLIPVFPFNFLNYAFGLTRVKFTHYVAASFVFMLPAVVAYTVFSSSLLDVLSGEISREFILGLALVVAVSMIPLLYRRFRKKAPPELKDLERAAGEEPGPRHPDEKTGTD